MWSLQDLPVIVSEAIIKERLELENLKNKTDHDLFDYVRDQIKDLPIFKAEKRCLHNKSNDRADKLRHEASITLIRYNSNWEEVMKTFTKAVASAEPNSTSLGMAYGNRSDALFQERLHEQCLKDIKRALKYKLPKVVKRKLKARKKIIEDIDNYYRELIYHHEVPRPPPTKNKLIPFTSGAIYWNKDAKWGPHVRAKKVISIGDVISVETPYVNQISPEYQYFHCHECLEMCYNPIACKICPKVLYCSKRCRTKAFKEYHKYECTLIRHGIEQPGLFVKMALKAVLSYDNRGKDMSIDEDPTLRLSMRTFKENKTAKELLRAVVEPVIFYHFLTKYTSILKDLKFAKKEQVLKGMLVKNFFIEEANRMNVEKMRRTYEPPPYFKTVGTAIYPFYSNFHHSCFCNAVPIFYGSKMVVRAIANIKKGELLTVNYGATFYGCPKEKRQRILQNRFHYTCQCTPCELGWPMRPELIAGPLIPYRLKNKISQYLIPGINDPETGESVLREICLFYNSLEVTDLPVDTIVSLRGRLANILKSFGNATDQD